VSFRPHRMPGIGQRGSPQADGFAGSQAVSADSVPQTGPLTVEHYLMSELNKAVSAEDFERAARIRDRLREMEEQERGIAEKE